MALLHNHPPTPDIEVPDPSGRGPSSGELMAQSDKVREEARATLKEARRLTNHAMMLHNEANRLHREAMATLNAEIWHGVAG